jgi:hypothetical protein
MPAFGSAAATAWSTASGLLATMGWAAFEQLSFIHQFYAAQARAVSSGRGYVGLMIRLTETHACGRCLARAHKNASCSKLVSNTRQALQLHFISSENQ